MSSTSENRKSQIFIGRVSRNTREKDLEKEFDHYGKIKELSMKNGFAFIVRTNAGIISPDIRR